MTIIVIFCEKSVKKPCVQADVFIMYYRRETLTLCVLRVKGELFPPLEGDLPQNVSAEICYPVFIQAFTYAHTIILVIHPGK